MYAIADRHIQIIFWQRGIGKQANFIQIELFGVGLLTLTHSWLSFGQFNIYDGFLYTCTIFRISIHGGAAAVVVVAAVAVLFFTAKSFFHFIFQSCSCFIVSVYNFIVRTHVKYICMRECIRNGEVTNWQIDIHCESVNSIDKHCMTFLIRLLKKKNKARLHGTTSKEKTVQTATKP